jgi:hypothetical protein
MFTSRIVRVFMGVAFVLGVTAAAYAHQMTIKGTVAAVESNRIQIKTGEEKKDQLPAWYPINSATKILRGKATLTFDKAKIAVGERVVALIDHEADGTMTTIELRLAER